MSHTLRSMIVAKKRVLILPEVIYLLLLLLLAAICRPHSTTSKHVEQIHRKKLTLPRISMLLMWKLRFLKTFDAHRNPEMFVPLQVQLVAFDLPKKWRSDPVF